MVAFNPLPENLLRQPIDYLMADHRRQTKVCDLLDSIHGDPEGETARSSATAILDYLAVDLPHHVADEEELFPSLAARCRPSDKVEALIDLLKAEHADNGALLEATEAALRAMAAQGAADGLAPALAVFAEAKRRHIRLENELLFPLARARLKPEDLRALGRTMALRRGVPFPD